MAPKKLEEVRKWVLLWNLQKEMQIYQDLTFSLVRPNMGFWSPAMPDNKFVLFQAMKLVVISNNKELIQLTLFVFSSLLLLEKKQ